MQSQDRAALALALGTACSRCTINDPPSSERDASRAAPSLTLRTMSIMAGSKGNERGGADTCGPMPCLRERGGGRTHAQRHAVTTVLLARSLLYSRHVSKRSGSGSPLALAPSVQVNHGPWGNRTPAEAQPAQPTDVCGASASSRGAHRRRVPALLCTSPAQRRTGAAAGGQKRGAGHWRVRRGRTGQHAWIVARATQQQHLGRGVGESSKQLSPHGLLRTGL